MTELLQSTNVRSFERRIALAAIPIRILGALAPALAARLLEEVFFSVLRTSPRPNETAILRRAHQDQILVGPRRITRYRWGTPGPKVLLVHGWAGHAGQLGAFVDPLLDAGFEVVAYDAPAHGASPGRRTHLPELIATLHTIARSDPPEVVIAHSLGTVAATAALTEGLGASRAVFLAPVDDPWAFLSKVRRALGLTAPVEQRMKQKVTRHLGISSKDLVTTLRARTFSRASAPRLLAFHDAEDRQVPLNDGQRLIQAWPQARLETTKSLGHTRLLRDPWVVETAVRFLADSSEEAQLALTA